MKHTSPSFDKLMAIPPETFMERHFERFYFLSRGEQNSERAGHCRDLFSFDDVDQILSVPGPRFQGFIQMSKGGHPISADEYSAPKQGGLATFDTEAILELYASGGTITLNQAHQCNERLAVFCAELAGVFCAPIAANVYITPPNSQGFAVHADTHDVILLQSEGRKRWKLQKELEFLATPRSPNVCSDPMGTGMWDEFVLEAGDALYIPRGLLHEGTTESSHSLHITIGIYPYTWADMAHEALAMAESTDALLRRSVISASPATVDDDANELLARLSPHLKALATREPRVPTHQASLHRGRFRALVEPLPISLTTAVRIANRADAQLERCSSEVVLHSDAKMIAFPSYVSPSLEILLHADVITGQDLAPNLDDEGRLTLLRRLHKEGVLELGVKDGPAQLRTR
ncbi:cupin domain-containing protein [Streptomyces sp. NPDC007157]|uniref:cupin domain-containing protein n=1 Tax=Streptomyces sp. NPDC007157 TaxID=3154681 RepID=UPI0033E163C8